jgi:asparagine synthase (glutamine-hydrolysing)
MCGIAGIIGLNKDYQVDPQLLDQMTDILVHRGPDNRGTNIIDHVGLGHRRLSIIDLSSAAHQPMANEDSSVWIVFNGEVYNFQSYVEELKSKGHIFKSNCDTEVIIHAYEEWGIDGCLKRLNGMFAFCLVDRKKDLTYIVRDRMGIKPLYFHQNQEKVVFGSEIKAVIKDHSIQRSLNLNAISQYLSQFYIAQPDTAFEGIHALEPGHYLKIGNANVKNIKYWDINIDQPLLEINDDLILNKLYCKLEQAVKLGKISDVPISLLLSGGLDSNAMLHILKDTEANEWNLNTFTIDTEEDSFSEGAVAGMMANKCGTNHSNCIIKAQDVIDDFDNIIFHQDQLSGNSASIGIYYLMKTVKDHSFKVTLMGSGPDELFGGYETYLADQYARYFRNPFGKLFLSMANLVAGVGKSSFEFVSWDYKLRKFYEGVKYSEEKAHYWWRSIITDKDKAQLFKSSVYEKISKDAFYAYQYFFEQASKEQSFLRRSLYADSKMFLTGNALMLADAASMAHSVEGRPLFLDHELVEYAFSMPDHLKVNGKSLKDAMKKVMNSRLPEDFLNMPKKGMNLPLSYWINGELRELVRDTLSPSKTKEIGLFEQRYIDDLLDEHQKQKQNNMYKIWNLVVFYRWYDLIFKA